MTAVAGSLRRGARALWCVALVLASFVALWPSVAGERVTNDDLKFVRLVEHAGEPWAAIVDAWRHGFAFRPLEILLGSTCDAETLAPGWTDAAQVAGLVVLVAATVALAGRVSPARRSVVAPVAVLLLLLSPGTTNALWQMDAASQTWSAALGAVALVLAWDGLQAVRAGRSPVRSALVLAAVFLLGCTVKETFYGWSVAIGGAVALAWVASWRRGNPGTRGIAVLLLPTVALPLAHAVLRMTTGALGAAPAGGEGGRYQAEFGINIVVNAAFSVAGSIANGPFHAVTDSSASPMIRVLPLLSCLFVIGALAVAGGFAWLHRREGDGSFRRALGLAAVCLASTVATLPAGAVSELYCFGANIGASVLLALALASLWSPVAADERTIGRSVAGVAFAVIVAVGVFGLAGRAYHHLVTWQYARLTNEAILAHAASVAPVDPASGKAAGVIYLTSSCILGRTYGQYVIPPAQALGLDCTQPWLLRRDPARPVIFTLDPPPGVLRPGDMVLDCASMPRRANW